MNRLFWISIGFLSGVITSVISSLLVYFWFFSPVRTVERVLGWKLPSGVALIWQRDQRDGFFGQGSTFSVFAVPNEFSHKRLATCPPMFKSGTFDQSGIPTTDAHVDGGLPSCFLSKEDLNRQDIIVLSENKLFHLRIDR